MKILIVGFGNMGKSHFKSFLTSKKNYQIFIVDKKFRTKFEKIYKNKKIQYSPHIPKKNFFDLTIVATNSNERYETIKNITDNNKLKYLILEKFLFNKANHYEKVKKISRNHKLKVMVNVWGKLILEPIIKKLNKKDILKINITVKKGELLANLIHFYDFIYCLLGKNFSLKSKNKINFIKSKRKGYAEGVFDLYSIKKPYISIKNLNFINYHMFEINLKNKIYKIKINYNGKCEYSLNNNRILEKKFPFSSLVTEKFFSRDFKNKKKIYFNNFNKISLLSLNIIKLLKKLSNKKICIT